VLAEFMTGQMGVLILWRFASWTQANTRDAGMRARAGRYSHPFASVFSSGRFPTSAHAP